MALPHAGAGIRRAAEPLRARAQGRAAPPASSRLMVMLGTIGADRLSLCRHSQGLLSAAGYGNDPRHRRSVAGHLLPGDGRAHAGGDPHRVLKDPAVASMGSQIGAGGATATLNDGRIFIALKPRGRARRQRRPGDQPAAPEARQAPGHHALYAGRPGHHHRGAPVQDPVPVHPRRRRCGRAEPLGRHVPEQAPGACRASST